MTTLALYRKYRPQSFQSVIGQDAIKNTLISMNISQNINHGFIFAGPKGTGKTTIAKIFAKAINCLTPINGDACNQCANCQLINSNSAIDILEQDAASNNGVDEIRNIIDNVLYLPISLKYKVYIIDEAHMLTTGAWNALLKTLEEPPKHAIFIFATTEYNKIPTTIISRCQRYDFHKLTNKQLESLILDVCQKEKIKIDSEACTEIALLADGAARDALSILSQLATYSNNNIKIENVNDVFNLIDSRELIKLINLLHKNQINDLIQTLHNFDDRGINWLNLTTNLINICMDKYLMSQQIDINLLNTNIEFLKLIEMDANECLRLANTLSNTLTNLKTSINATYSFELQCLNFINTKDNSSIESKNRLATELCVNEVSVTKTSKTKKTTIKDNDNEQISAINLSNVFQTTTRHDLMNKPNFEKPINLNKQITNEEIPILDSSINPYDLLNPNNQSLKCWNQINQEIFNVIVNNQNKELVKEQQANLNDYLDKHQFDLNQYVGILKNISKIWVANANGTILAFPTQESVEEFNKALNNQEFISILSEIFGDNKVLFAIDNAMRDNMKQAYLNAKKNNAIPNTFDSQGLVKTINSKCSSIKDEIKKLLD